MVKVDIENGLVCLEDETGIQKFKMDSKEAFQILSDLWLRCGWDNKYVYGFTWFGRPIIQLPDDMIRIQEVIYRVKPDVIIETGIAHGGSLVFYASILKAMGRGRVIGVDIEIRPHNRLAIESHEMFELITLIEGDSIDNHVLEQVNSQVKKDEKVLVILDSKHSKEHVLRELQLYSTLVSPQSYIVATDGIMQNLKGAPRSNGDWDWNNPQTAVKEFLSNNSNFVLEEPEFPFNEGNVTQRVTYWPNSYIKKLR